VLKLEAKAIPEGADVPKPKQKALPINQRPVGMPAKPKAHEAEEKVTSYRHKDRRIIEVIVHHHIEARLQFLKNRFAVLNGSARFSRCFQYLLGRGLLRSLARGISDVLLEFRNYLVAAAERLGFIARPQGSREHFGSDRRLELPRHRQLHIPAAFPSLQVGGWSAHLARIPQGCL
jgi:hypothetical protein